MSDPEEPDTQYAQYVADASYNWYKSHAIRARHLHRTADIALLVIGAAIPTVVVVVPDDATPPALLGALVVVISGLRSIFHWQENYVRFSQAREAVDAERRLYRLRSAPYDDATRDQKLVSAITRIEQQEMRGWVEIASQPPRQQQ